ncbi:MAG TPA: HipA family kinase [Clostridia bacterium]|nr:HipA family kinase [Clostridia bacterium]
MRGGAQSHLMRCSDGELYVVKFQNNPQHRRVLANELFATRLAERAGLPVPSTDIVMVDGWLVDHTPELAVQLAHGSLRCQAGAQFGSRYVVDPADGVVYDYLPEHMLDRVRNLNAFAGILALDKWTCNSNGRQAAFWRKSRERKFTATFIDQGYCFNAGEWRFTDAPLRGVYARNEVYRGVTGWESFQPWLSRIEGMDEETIWSCARDIPPEWYGDTTDLEQLVEQLAQRKGRVAELILEFKDSTRQPFPNWIDQVH